MSKRLAACGPVARSPTQSLSTSGRKFQLIASTTVARTQPLVVQPVTTSESTPRPTSQLARSVPKKHEAWVLRTTSSPGRGASSGTMALACAASVSRRRPGALAHQTPASEPSSA